MGCGQSSNAVVKFDTRTRSQSPKDGYRQQNSHNLQQKQEVQNGRTNEQRTPPPKDEEKQSKASLKAAVAYSDGDNEQAVVATRTEASNPAPESQPEVSESDISQDKNVLQDEPNKHQNDEQNIQQDNEGIQQADGQEKEESVTNDEATNQEKEEMDTNDEATNQKSQEVVTNDETTNQESQEVVANDEATNQDKETESSLDQTQESVNESDKSDANVGILVIPKQGDIFSDKDGSSSVHSEGEHDRSSSRAMSDLGSSSVPTNTNQSFISHDSGISNHMDEAATLMVVHKTQDKMGSMTSLKSSDSKSESPVQNGGSTEEVCIPGLNAADNVITDHQDDIPQIPPKLRPATFDCLYGHSKGKWPIRNFAQTNFSVNAHHGGCAMLMLCSCGYGGKGEDTTAEIVFFRCGFDCNHFETASIQKNHKGHFGCHNCFVVDEGGQLLGDLMFGNNDIMLLSNDSLYGTIGNGIYIEGPQDPDESQTLHIDINASGNCMVLCSGTEAGVDSPKAIFGAYMIRTGFKDNHLTACSFFGEDKWKFEATESGILTVKGCGRSHYTLYHNREEKIQKDGLGKPYVLQTQATDGTQRTLILSQIPEYGQLLLLCSNSKGTETATAAAMYMVTIATDQSIEMKEIKSLKGDLYDTADLWKVEKENGKLVITGPPGPCKYAVISNIQGNGAAKFCQDLCLATGEPQPVRGMVDINLERVIGIVDKPSKISIRVDHRWIVNFHSDDLKKLDQGWGFCRKWKEGEITVGLHMIQVHMVRDHVTTGKEQYIHMTGSPTQIVKQKTGVIYALNCGLGSAYTAINGVTYTTEHKQFCSFTYDFNSGSRYTTLGKGYMSTQIPQLLCKTYDGFLYCTVRTPAIEPIDEQKIRYKIENIPNGNHTFRIHLLQRVSSKDTLNINGQEMIAHVAKVAGNLKHVIPEHKGYTAYYADFPLTISDNVLTISLPRNPCTEMCGFALLDKTYEEDKKTPEEVKKEENEKQILMDKMEPLQRSMIRKELVIVGWSQNLLKNASGEAGDLSHWNTSGSWKLHEGGYGTETSFVTSHMACTKYQEVNLLEFFAADYLDTAPEIQVSEWHREGVCGGGHYQLDVVLMNEEGEAIQEFSTGMSGKIYNNNNWINKEFTFKDYGKGARIVGMSTTGKDDKFWAGHYGPIISNACIRVKRESVPASDDSFTDINMDVASDGSTWIAKRESLVAKVLTDNKDLLKELLEDESVPSLDAEFEKQTEITPGHNEKKRKQQPRKKREIRVFVSSTFKDFSREREQIIKKTFREINRLCADRGVFFTYVDLRWGINAEQSEGGKTIAICLQEIERCRPYFLCLMGYRFGWSQQEGKVDNMLDSSYNYAIENCPSLKWIDNFRYDTSVTQLEIYHGVLNDVDAVKDRSFFYMRTPVKKEEVDDATFKNCSSESSWHKDQQESLRNRVKDTPGLNIRTFVTPEEVSDSIKEDLQWCVEQDFPAGTELTPLEREREAHQAFADARCRVYIGRQEYFVSIDENLDKGLSQPFVLLGESGSGKSALVANWAKQVRDRQPGWFVFIHFIGSSAESASYIKLLRRLYEEIKDFFGFDLSIPSSDANLITDLSKWLHLAAARNKCVIVFDALNQLDDGTGTEGPEHDLLWIPKDLPNNVFLLLSTLPGKAMDAINGFEWPSMRVKPLDPSQKMEILTGYLEGLYSKTLSKEQKDMIVDVTQTDNPLYLKSLLDEVRVYGSFSKLTRKIEEYLTASNPGDLFAKILDRLETDFENLEEFEKALVRETTSAIWCSHRGMAESEIIDLLEVPSVIWSPFYLSIAENLVNRNGILNFFHDHLRQAVETKYLSTPEAKRKAYLKLADFFEQRELDERVVDELPFLLARSGDLERLRKTISNLDVFKIMVKSEDGMFELIKSWKLLGDFNQVEETYLAKLSEIPESQKHSEKFSDLLNDLGTFFVHIGLYGAARNVYEKLIQDLESRYEVSHGTIVYHPLNHSWKYRSQHPDVINALHKLGLVCEKQNELTAGVRYYKDAISRQNRIVTPEQKLQLCEGLLGLASIFYLQEDMKEAKKLMVRSLELATDVLGKRHHYVATILNKLGQLSYGQSRLDEALGYQLQDLKLTRSEVGLTHPRIAGILNEIALVYDDKNDQLAGELYEASLIILLDMYGSAHVDVALVRYNLGTYYFATNHFAKAKYQFQESYNIFLSFLGDEHPDTKTTKAALDEITPMVKI